MCKVCTKCKIEKSTNDFYKDTRRSDGLRSWCKKCQLLDNKKRENYYNQTRKKYRKDHQDEHREKKRQYYKDNKDKILTLGKVWRKETFNGRLTSYKRSALKRGFSWELTEEEFKSFWKLPCNYCGTEISTIGLDRIDPLKGYILSNVTPCCYQCNIIKMDYTEKEFINKIKQIYDLQRSRGRFD